MRFFGTLVVFLVLATAAIAQSFFNPPTLASPGMPMPITSTVRAPDGTVTGTATAWGNQVVFRDVAGEIISSAQIVGMTATYYDPHGKVLASATTKDGVVSMHDGNGKLTGTVKVEGDIATFFDASGVSIGTRIRK